MVQCTSPLTFQFSQSGHMVIAWRASIPYCIFCFFTGVRHCNSAGVRTPFPCSRQLPPGCDTHHPDTEPYASSCSVPVLTCFITFSIPAQATDLHRHFIDHLTIPSKQGKGLLRRVDEVFDCWFESGSMPYGQLHYPFENKDRFEKSFPADFVAGERFSGYCDPDWVLGLCLTV